MSAVVRTVIISIDVTENIQVAFGTTKISGLLAEIILLPVSGRHLERKSLGAVGRSRNSNS
jgi:hypothetical protein